MTRRYRQPWRCISCCVEHNTGKRHKVSCKTVNTTEPLYVCEKCVNKYQNVEKNSATSKIVRKIFDFKIRGVLPEIGDTDFVWRFGDKDALAVVTDDIGKVNATLKISPMEEKLLTVDLQSPNVRQNIKDAVDEAFEQAKNRLNNLDKVVKIMHRALERAEKCYDGSVILEKDLDIDHHMRSRIFRLYQDAVRRDNERRRTLRSSGAKS